MTTTRAAIYCRVATGTPDVGHRALQEAACRQYAAERGYVVTAVYCEVAAGSRSADRPQLRALQAAQRHRELDVLVCTDPDRLSRDFVQFNELLAEAEHAGSSVKFVSGAAFTDTPHFSAASNRPPLSCRNTVKRMGGTHG